MGGNKLFAADLEIDSPTPLSLVEVAHLKDKGTVKVELANPKKIKAEVAHPQN